MATIVTAESLFNDGTALVFYSTMVAIALGVTTSPAATFEQFLLSVAGALALGIAFGVLGSDIVVNQLIARLSTCRLLAKHEVSHLCDSLSRRSVQMPVPHVFLRLWFTCYYPVVHLSDISAI